eukprot:173266_1
MGNSPSPPPPQKKFNYDFLPKMSKKPIIVTPSIASYYVSKIEWYHRPLKNPGKYVGGRHSKIHVEFTILPEKKTEDNYGYAGAMNLAIVNNFRTLWDLKKLPTLNQPWKYEDNVMRTISFVVERHQKGVYISSGRNMPLYKDEKYIWADQNFNSKNYSSASQGLPNFFDSSLFGVNLCSLKTFLNVCLAHSKDIYSVDSTDCHCFAKNMFDICSHIKPDKVNNLLTKFCKTFGINSKSSRATAPAPREPKQIKIDTIIMENKKQKYSDEKILENLKKYQ